MRTPVIGVAFPRPDYVTALEQAGAVVCELTPGADAVDAAIEHIDGLLLTGGPDVRPSAYGADAIHPTVQIDDVRDAYELLLARAALVRRLPLLAICRGMQVLNVAAGGTLVQDIPTGRPSQVVHAINEPRDAVAHVVQVTPDSRLAEALAADLGTGATVPVNSRHHQAVDRLGQALVPTAVAPDGLLEAFEGPGPFCVAVQWHPENFHRSGRFAGLFTALIDAARAVAHTRAGA